MTQNHTSLFSESDTLLIAENGTYLFSGNIRLIDYSVLIIDIADDIPNTNVEGNLTKQIGRSGTSSALNYGESRGAESIKDSGVCT